MGWATRPAHPQDMGDLTIRVGVDGTDSSSRQGQCTCMYMCMNNNYLNAGLLMSMMGKGTYTCREISVYWTLMVVLPKRILALSDVFCTPQSLYSRTCVYTIQPGK